MQTKHTQDGRSMVEILGVIAIIGVLTVGGLLYYNYNLAKNKMNIALNNAMHVAVNTMSFFKEKDLEAHEDEMDENNRPLPWDITQYARDFGYVSSGMNPWNKSDDSLKVELNKENTVVRMATIEVYYMDVPEWVCQRLGYQNKDDILYVAVVTDDGEEIINTLDSAPEAFIEKCKQLSVDYVAPPPPPPGP